MNLLEEGTNLQLDFARLTRLAQIGQHVLPVALQDADSLEVLFIGYANEQAIQESLRSGRAVLWSTSRNELWRKGDTSGDVLNLVEIRVNCEQNSLLYLVRPVHDGACHTRDHFGKTRRSCYYRRVVNDGSILRLGMLPHPKAGQEPNSSI
jgi:phosphoribosyl-AMP cyclohydrolase